MPGGAMKLAQLAMGFHGPLGELYRPRVCAGASAASAFGAVAGYPPLPEGDRMPTSEPMAAALAEARSALGWTSPHPAVGAVVVRDGAIVGVGPPSRRAATTPRSRALAAAGGRAPGATVFVTLEPCSHHAAPRGSTPSMGCRRHPSPAPNHAMRRQGRGSSRHSPSCGTRRAAWRGVPRAARLRGAAGRPCRGHGRRGQQSSTGRARRRRAIGHR